MEEDGFEEQTRWRKKTPLFEALVYETPLKPRTEEAEAGSTGRFGADRDFLLQRGTMAFTTLCRALAFRMHPGELGKGKPGEVSLGA